MYVMVMKQGFMKCSDCLWCLILILRGDFQYLVGVQVYVSLIIRKGLFVLGIICGVCICDREFLIMCIYRDC